MKDSDWEILHELYQNPNMTKVANLLYMTQPSLTKRLQHIEEEFQVTVVNRSSKGLSFTQEGEYLAKQAGKYLEFLKKTKDQLKEFQENQESLITIGSSYTYNKYTLTDLLIPYRLAHPNVNFNVISEQSNILFRKMLEGSIDVGFVRGDYEGEVNRLLVGKNPAYVVTREPVDLEDLPSLQRIGYKTNEKTLEILESWWKEQYACEAPGSMVVGYIDVAWQLIQKGLGYTLCFLPDQFENPYGLTLTPLRHKDGSSVVRNTWFLYSKEKRITETLEDFIVYIEQKAAWKNRGHDEEQ